MLKLLPKAILPFVLILLVPSLTGCSKDENVREPGAIEGIVKEKDSDNPLFGAQVILTSGYSTFSGEDGKFGFIQLLPERYMLQCYMNGYIIDSFPISVSDNRKTLCEIDMEKGSNVLSVNSTIFDFGADASERILTIQNNSDIPGSELVIVETVNTDTWLTVTPEVVNLKPGESKTVEIKADRSKVKKNMKSLIQVKGLNKTIYLLANIKYQK